ncbi:MAG TPA: hypothetical protein VM925_19945 [Labilithrix sp.]|nr:hypothetical protein [Labilithrix sp.]
MRSSRWLPLARRTVTALAVAGVIACTSPTLPLPPPSLPTVSAGSEPNTFRLKSDKGALPNALIIVVNRNPSLSRDERVEGTLADEQGSWDLEIVGRTGDVVDVSQEHGDTQSGTTSVTLK